jgi:hypothetical protein
MATAAPTTPTKPTATEPELTRAGNPIVRLGGANDSAEIQAIRRRGVEINARMEEIRLRRSEINHARTIDPADARKTQVELESLIVENRALELELRELESNPELARANSAGLGASCLENHPANYARR